MLSLFFLLPLQLSSCILNALCLYWGHSYSPQAEHIRAQPWDLPGCSLPSPLLSHAASSLCVHPNFQGSCACLLFLTLQHTLLAPVHLVEYLFLWAVYSASSIVSLGIQTSKRSPFVQHAHTNPTNTFKMLSIKKITYVIRVWNDEHIILPADGNQSKEKWLLIISNSTWNQVHFTQGSSGVATHHKGVNGRGVVGRGQAKTSCPP